MLATAQDPKQVLEDLGQSARRVMRRPGDLLVDPARAQASSIFRYWPRSRSLVAAKVEETRGKISAKRLLPEARGAGHEGSDRNFRRSVAHEKSRHRQRQAIARSRPPAGAALEFDRLELFCTGDLPEATAMAKILALAYLPNSFSPTRTPTLAELAAWAGCMSVAPRATPHAARLLGGVEVRV